MAEKKLKYDQVESAPSKIKNAANVEQFEYLISDGFQITGAGDTTVSFNAANKRITINSTPGSGGGGAVTSFNSRTGGVVAAEGDYSLNLLGDVTINTPINNNILLYNSGNTQWENKVLNTSVVPELTNLYFTEARTRNTLLTGFSSSPATVTPTDTLLQAINKLDGNDSLKAPLASPALTGTPTAPTPTTTTGIANKGYVDGLDANNVKLTGAQTITGLKTVSSSADNPSLIINSSGSTTNAVGLVVNQTGGKTAIFGNSANGVGIQGTTTSSVGINAYSNGTGKGLVAGSVSGTAIEVSSFFTDTSLAFDLQRQLSSGGTYSSVFSVNRLGNVTATAHVTTGGTTAQFVDGTGALQAKSQFQNAISGTANYLTKFGSGGVVQSQVFDNGNNVGIGTTTPTAKLTISGFNEGAGFDIHNTTANKKNRIITGNVGGNLQFENNDGIEIMRLLQNGNMLVNTTTDNTVDKLQVNGTISASPATLSNQVVVKSQLDEVAPIKTYKAIIAQTGTNAPTVTRTFKNTFGTWSISRSAVGSYSFILVGAFPTGYGEVQVTNGYNAVAGYLVANVGSPGTVSIFTYNSSGVLADGILNNCSLSVNRWE